MAYAKETLKDKKARLFVMIHFDQYPKFKKL